MEAVSFWRLDSTLVVIWVFVWQLGYYLIPKDYGVSQLGGGLLSFLACLTTLDVPNDFFLFETSFRTFVGLARRSFIFNGKKESMEAGCVSF